MPHTHRRTARLRLLLLAAALTLLLALPMAATAATPAGVHFSEPGPGALISDLTRVTVTWTDPDLDVLPERFRVGASTTTLGAYGSRQAYIDSSGLLDGPHTFTPIVKYDSSTAYFTGPALVLYVDNAAPTTPITAGPAANDVVGVGVHTWSIAASDGFYGTAGVSSVTCTLQDAAGVTLASRSCRSLPFASPELVAGRYRLVVDATDRRGHDAVTQARAFTVVDAPNARITAGAAEAATVGEAIQSFTVGADDTSATLQCRVTARGATGTFLPCAAGAFATAPLADGEWTFEVVANRGSVVGPIARRQFTVQRPAATTAPPTTSPAAPVVPVAAAAAPTSQAAAGDTPASAQVVVAAARRWCIVPVLRGYTLTAARARLKRANCGIGMISHARGRHARAGRVSAQGLAPGSVLPADRRVAIRLGR